MIAKRLGLSPPELPESLGTDWVTDLVDFYGKEPEEPMKHDASALMAIADRMKKENQ